MIATITLPDGRKLACSAGVAATSGEHVSDGDLFRYADRALYEPKRQGRGRTAVAGAPRVPFDTLAAHAGASSIADQGRSPSVPLTPQ